MQAWGNYRAIEGPDSMGTDLLPAVVDPPSCASDEANESKKTPWKVHKSTINYKFTQINPKYCGLVGEINYDGLTGSESSASVRFAATKSCRIRM